MLKEFGLPRHGYFRLWFYGDPFSEPQGLNSIFDTDKGTLAVIAQANEKLTGIAQRFAKKHPQSFRHHQK